MSEYDNMSTDELLALLKSQCRKATPEEAVDLVSNGAKLEVFGKTLVVIPS
jgi:hypothetical protein